jgi:hypothetical protein
MTKISALASHSYGLSALKHMARDASGVRCDDRKQDGVSRRLAVSGMSYRQLVFCELPAPERMHK